MITESSEANVVIEDSYPMLLIGRDHRVSYANARAHQLLGYEHGGLHGLSVEQLLLPSRRAEVRNVQAVLVGQAPRSWKSALRDAGGVSVEVHLAIEPCLDYRGQVIAVKVRAERAVRSRPPLPAEHFDSGSGTRRIVPVPGTAQTVSRPAQASVPPPLRTSMPPPMPRESMKVPRTTAAERPQPKSAAKQKRVSTAASPTPVHALRPATPVKSVRPPPPVNSVRPPPPVNSVRPPPPVSSVRPPPPVSTVRPPAPTQPELSKAKGASLKAPPPLNTLTPAKPVATLHAPPTVRTLKPSAPASKTPQPRARVESTPSIASPAPTVRTTPPPPSQLVLGDDATEQLETALQLLGWLRSRVDNRDGLDDPRERARMQYVLTEATELVAQVRCDARRR